MKRHKKISAAIVWRLPDHLLDGKEKSKTEKDCMTLKIDRPVASNENDTESQETFSSSLTGCVKWDDTERFLMRAGGFCW